MYSLTPPPVNSRQPNLPPTFDKDLISCHDNVPFNPPPVLQPLPIRIPYIAI